MIVPNKSAPPSTPSWGQSNAWSGPATTPAPTVPATGAPAGATAGAALVHIAQRIGLFVFAGAVVVFLAGTRFRMLAWGFLATAFLYMLTKRNGAQSIEIWVAQLEKWAGVS